MPPTISKKLESPSEEETREVRDEITSIYQKLLSVGCHVLDGKNRFAATDQSNEFEDILTEAKNVIRRVKDTRGTVEDYKMFSLLIHTVDEMSKNTHHTVDEMSKNTHHTVDEISKNTITNEQKFDVEEYAQNLSRKFNFSADNSANVIVTKLQVIRLGKEVSKYFIGAPTTEFVRRALDTGDCDGEMSVKINDLPNELLRFIFFMVPLADRKMAVLVSQRWRKVAEDPVLWKSSVVKIRIEDDINKLSVRRICFVQEIVMESETELIGDDEIVSDSLSDMQLEKLFQATLGLPKLRKIERLEYHDLSGVNSQLLGKALGRLEELWLEEDFRTTNDQRLAIFSEMAEKNLLKSLILQGIDLCTLEVDASVLAKAMSNLRKLQLDYVYLTSDQVQKIFQSISENKNQLYVVHFSGLVSNLSTVDPTLLAKSLSKLDEVVLSFNNLTNRQVQAIFTELKQNCELKYLNLEGNNLSSVNTDSLATVVNNIEEVILNFTNLTTEQITAVLTRVQENSKLKKLSIYGNRNVQVETALITRAKEIVDLDGFNYEDDDYIAIESDTELNEDDYESQDGFIYDGDYESIESDTEHNGDEYEYDESQDGFIYESNESNAVESETEFNGDDEIDSDN